MTGRGTSLRTAQIKARAPHVDATHDNSVNAPTASTSKATKGNTTAGPLGFGKPINYVQAREVLAQAGYEIAKLSRLLKGKIPTAPNATELTELMRLTNGRSPLETLVRLFLFNVEASVEDTQRALGSMKLETWVEAGAISVESRTVIPAIRILPFMGCLVAVETAAATRSRNPDFVLGISGSSATLAQLMVRRPIGRMLDIGTGCGIHALLAARFCERVHATDVNPRAVMFARFNAHLNGLSNVSVDQGDLFEPVHGLSFDLITSNPPHAISPDSKYVYRESGMRGDEFVQRLIRQAPEFLADGGFCQLTCNWAHIHNQRWQERVARWFEGTGCDAWIMRRYTQTPSDYATSWSDRHHTKEEAADNHRRWVAYYDRERIEAISMGLITMRRRLGSAPWVRMDDWTAKLSLGAGDDVLQGFEAQDFLEHTRDDAALLYARVRLSPQARLDQTCKPSENGWRCVRARLRRAGGLACSGAVDPHVLNLLARCDGTRQLKDVINGLAASMPENARPVSSAYLHAVRQLIARGFLLPDATGKTISDRVPESDAAKVMILMRGLPSCGKSEAAIKLADSGGVLIEFDEYFYTQVGEDPSRYDWSHDLMPQARQWNCERILSAVDTGAKRIIVDSDNLPDPFTRQFVGYAVDRGYEIRFKEPDSPWWQTIRPLLKNKQANGAALRAWAQALSQMSRTTHRVPLQNILHRMNQWEETSLDLIMAAA